MSANETDALVARVERIVAIAERQVGCIPEMFHLADADDGRLLQECSAEYPHQCFDEPGHHALTLADIRALLAQLEAAKRDSKLLREGLQRIATLTIDLRDHSAVTMARFASNVLAGRSYFDSDGAPDNAD